jgi:GNAT superfamily N-acetyltransferase
MSDIIQTISPAEMPEIIDANKLAFGELLGRLPQARFHHEAGLRWFETGIPLSTFNGVLQTQIEPAALPGAIERIQAHFQQRSLPFEWHIGPASRPANIGQALQERGIAFDEELPGMAVDLRALNEDLPTAAGLRIVPVTADALLRQWVLTWGCGAPQYVTDHWYTVYSGLLRLASPDVLSLYLGLLNEAPVATVYLFFAAGVASIEYVVTLPQIRRQGIGAAMTLFAAQEARRQGYRVAVLTASPFGINIYRQLGFREYGAFGAYAWEPASAS